MDIFDKIDKKYRNKNSLLMSYSIADTLNTFNIERYVENNDLEDNNGFAIFTEKQYIFGHNLGEGLIPHVYTFARAQLELERYPIDENLGSMTEALIRNKDTELSLNHIVARMEIQTNEKKEIIPRFHIMFPRNYITSKEYYVIETFFHDYYEDFKRYNFILSSFIKGLTKTFYFTADETDNFLNDLKGIIDDTKEIHHFEDEPILGKEIKPITL